MKKYSIMALILFLLFFAYNIDASEVKVKVEVKDFHIALSKCTEYTDGKKTVIGNVEGQCQTEEIKSDGSKIVCNFDMDKLALASTYYMPKTDSDEDINTLSGDYNINFKMNMPEIDFDNTGKDGEEFNFNLKMMLPEIKIEKNKTPAELLIEGSCK